MNYLCEHGIYYREIKSLTDRDSDEFSWIVYGYHNGKPVSQRIIAVVGKDTIYRLVNLWNSRSPEWKYFVSP